MAYVESLGHPSRNKNSTFVSLRLMVQILVRDDSLTPKKSEVKTV